MKKITSLLGLFILFTSVLQAQHYWTTVTNDGFGNSMSSSTPVLNAFKNKLYMSCTSSYNDSARLYSSSSGDENSFQLSFVGDFYRSFGSMVNTNEGGGFMYVAEKTYSNSKVYKTFDGTTFTPYFNSSGEIEAIIPFKGLGTVDSIYIIMNASVNGFVWKSAYDSNDPDNVASEWTQVYTAPNSLEGAAVHNNELFVIEKYATGLYKSSNGITFDTVLFTPPSGASASNSGFSAVGSFGGFLYVCTKNNSDGTEIWKSNTGGTSWTLVGKYPNYDLVCSFKNHGSDLWLTLAGNSTVQKALVLRSSDGNTFSTALNSNFENPGSLNGKEGNTELFNNHIFYSFTPNFSGGDYLLKTCLTPPSINLGTDQVKCFGDSVTFAAPSGNYTYYWSTEDSTQSITTIDGNIYFCIITDANGCAEIDSVKLTIDSIPKITTIIPTTLPATVCNGSSLMIINNAVSNIRTQQPLIPKVANIAIPYGATISDSINVANFFENANLTIDMVRIDSLIFPNTQKLQLYLVAPDNSSIVLNSVIPPYQQNFIGTEFNAQANATNNLTTGTTPYTGVFAPDVPFSSLTGTTNGYWKLKVINTSTGDQGILKHWSIRFTMSDTNMTYSWTPSATITDPTGSFPTIMSLKNSASPTATTDYILSTTNSKGCTSKDTFQLIVPQMNIVNVDTTLCSSGIQVNLQASSNGGTLTWYEVGNSTPIGTGPTISVTPNATTYYYAELMVGSCTVLDTVKITINPPITVSSATATPAAICQDYSTTFNANTSGGTPPYTYVWYHANDTAYGQNAITYPIASATYSVNITDSVSCSVTYTVSVAVTPSTDVIVNVNSPNGKVTSGHVVIYKDTSLTAGIFRLDTADYSSTNNNGYYTFSSLKAGNYWIKIFPDTAIASGFADLIPTYFGDEFQWDSILVNNKGMAVHSCSQKDTFDIMTMKMQGFGGSGLGKLRGIIVEGNGFDRAPTDPIPGADVKVGRKPPGGNIAATTTTDTSSGPNRGWYEFNNLPVNMPGEKYVIYVDIPGYGLDSAREVIIDANNLQHLQLNYFVDSTMIRFDTTYYSGVGIADYTSINHNQLSIYPNPSVNNTTITYTLQSQSDVLLNLYNIMGVKLETLVNKKQWGGNQSYVFNYDSKYAAGIYFIELRVENKISIARLVISK